MITSTLTRPTTISPITTCERQVQLVETVDIAPLRQPKPRLVTVETLSRKPIHRMSTRSAIAASNGEMSQNSAKAHARNLARCSTVSTVATLHRPPLSPARSEMSSASMRSSPTSSHHTGLLRLPSKSSNDSDGVSSGCASDEMVTATIQLLQGGCLPGDKLPLEISISHNRPVKSLQGIIITMYREGHVDTHPAIPLGPSQPGKKQQYEDYYPKSRTGLGGLSLSSAGSSSGFRKNLSQKIVPLIVDPQSLHATVKTSIQAPEDVFPTISSVPGAMITFKYFIEVVIDLGGKFTGSDRILPRLHMTGWASKLENGDSMGGKSDAPEGLTVPFGVPLNFLNTEGLRREKGVVSCVFEVIVGTRDSRRKRIWPSDSHLALMPYSSDARRSAEGRTGGMSNVFPTQPPPHETPMSSSESPEDPRGCDGGPNPSNGMSRSGSYIIPPPEFEGELDEKARIRRAEQQLLPSAPSEDFASRPTNNAYEQPSAPWVFDDQDLFLVQGDRRTDALVHDRIPASSVERYEPSGHLDHPTVAPGVKNVPSTAGLQDDKLELERRRLEMAVSSPDDPQGCNPVGLESHVHQPALSTAQPTGPGLYEHYPPEGYDPPESQLTSVSDRIQMNIENLPQYKQ